MAEGYLLKVNDLTKHFPLGGGLFSKPRYWVKAVNGVSFNLDKGESSGIVGESGCGKSTLGRLVIGLIKPSGGRIIFEGKELSGLSSNSMSLANRRMQIIFQDPYSSLDPRMKVISIITEPLKAIEPVSKIKRREIGAELLERVGLREVDLDKYPHEFSGGQRQRIGIARALCVRPALIVADEPVSALDVSIQAQVINLMMDLKEDFNLSYIFISHDLSVVEHVCDRVAVMYLGTLFELAPSKNFIISPQHPYTRALLEAVPQPNPHLRSRPSPMEGDVPSPINPPPGCTFHPRCKYAFSLCRERRPPLQEVSPNHFIACWLNN